MTTLLTFPTDLDVRIDTTRGGFVKRRDDGRVEFVSPLPCPFNYGSVEGTQAPDGDREDAIVLGGKLKRGSQLRVRVLGRVRFVDAGIADDKWLCGDRLTPRELRHVGRFFKLYARAKRVLNVLRGARGATRFEGIELPESALTRPV